MRTLATLTLATLALLLPGALALPGALTQERQVATVEEPESEVKFPVELTVTWGKDQEATHDLCGMGLRWKRKFLINWKVYAFGFYLDDAALPALRKAAGDLSPEKLADSKDFRRALLAAGKEGFGRTMRLVMTRDVDADTMAEAFEGSLWPRMEEASEAGKERDAAKTALDTFRGFFEKEAEEEQEMIFSWLPGDKLKATVDGKSFPLVESAALCQALFDVYLGADPISDSAKEDIFEKLHAKLHPKKEG